MVLVPLFKVRYDYSHTIAPFVHVSIRVMCLIVIQTARIGFVGCLKRDILLLYMISLAPNRNPCHVPFRAEH